MVAPGTSSHCAASPPRTNTGLSSLRSGPGSPLQSGSKPRIRSFWVGFARRDAHGYRLRCRLLPQQIQLPQSLQNLVPTRNYRGRSYSRGFVRRAAGPQITPKSSSSSQASQVMLVARSYETI
jgi:hypothetical protein